MVLFFSPHFYLWLSAWRITTWGQQQPPPLQIHWATCDLPLPLHSLSVQGEPRCPISDYQCRSRLRCTTQPDAGEFMPSEQSWTRDSRRQEGSAHKPHMLSPTKTALSCTSNRIPPQRYSATKLCFSWSSVTPHLLPCLIFLVPTLLLTWYCTTHPSKASAASPQTFCFLRIMDKSFRLPRSSMKLVIFGPVTLLKQYFPRTWVHVRHNCFLIFLSSASLWAPPIQRWILEWKFYSQIIKVKTLLCHHV